MERRFPQSPLLHEETQFGCSWGFRSVFELIFHGHSTRKLLSNRTRVNHDNGRKKNDPFRAAAKAKFWDDKAVDHREVGVKSKVPFSPPSNRTCWPSMLKDSDMNSHKKPDKDSRSTFRGTFYRYLHLKDRSYDCRNIVDSEALSFFSSNQEMFLRLVENPDLHRCRARKTRQLRQFRRCKRIVLSWKRTRLRKKLVLKNSRIVGFQPRTDFRSYFSFKHWIGKLKRHERERTSKNSKETNYHNWSRTGNLVPRETQPRKSLDECQVHETIHCTTSFDSEGFIGTDQSDKTDKHSEVPLESSPETEDSVPPSPNLPTNELDPIHNYVKSLLLSAGLKWDDLVLTCQVSDQLLLPTLYQEVKLKPGDSDSDSLLLFDYVNEVLLEVYSRHASELCFFLAEENVCREAMRCVDWDLVLQNRARTLEQVVKRDLKKFGSWVNDRNGDEDLVAEMVESILGEVIEELLYEA